MTVPADSGIELAVPVPIAAGRHGVRGRRQAVRAGTVLARRRLPPWGTPRFSGGRSLVLPGGQNTETSLDGTELRATCDGEVMLRNLLIEVVPMHVHEGDLAGSAAIIRSHLPVFVTGSVLDGASIDAGGEIYVVGSVLDAHLVSRDGDVSVLGAVTGSQASPSVLHARGDVCCGPARHGRITAGGDVRLLVDARHSSIKTAGSLYLPQTIDRSLIDTVLHVEGGLYPPLEPPPAPLLPTPDRQHVRVATLLTGYIAVHTPPPPAFRVCTVLDVSTRGARCRLDPPMYELVPGTVAQLKIVLPGSSDPVVLIARVARVIAPGVVGLHFMQMMLRDDDRLTTFCMQLVLSRSHVDLPNPERRGRPLP